MATTTNKTAPQVQENEGLMAKIKRNPIISAITGAIVLAALEAGLVLNATGPHTLRFLPPLVCAREDVDALIERLAALL